MKAIWGKPKLYRVAEDDGGNVLLEPVNESEGQQVWIGFDDPDLILDPTDDEIAALEIER